MAFCRQTVRSTLTLDLARGSLTMPLKLREVLPSLSSFIQVGRGEVSGGTGVYAAAKGPVAGGGAGSIRRAGRASAVGSSTSRTCGASTR